MSFTKGNPSGKDTCKKIRFNMKETKYIDLDLDKWIKEKGFDKWLDVYSEKNHGLSGWLENDLYIDEVELPIELINSLIVKWLLEKHNIWVQVTISTTNFGVKNNINEKFKAEVIHQNRNVKFKNLMSTTIARDGILSPFNSPKEAYSAAFDWIKNENLI